MNYWEFASGFYKWEDGKLVPYYEDWDIFTPEKLKATIKYFRKLRKDSEP